MREVRETASALQDGSVALTVPLFALLSEAVLSMKNDSSASAPYETALVQEVGHCMRLCLPGIWAHAHDGLLSAGEVLSACSSLQQLAGAGINMSMPYSMSLSGDTESAADETPSDMVIATANFLLATSLKRHTGQVKQAHLLADKALSDIIGAAADKKLGKTPGLVLTYADRVTLLQCLRRASLGMGQQQNEAFRLLLLGLTLPDAQGDSLQNVALPAATDALVHLSAIVADNAHQQAVLAGGVQLAQVMQAYSMLLQSTLKILQADEPVEHSTTTSGSTYVFTQLDPEESANVALACIQAIHAMIDLHAAYLRATTSTATSEHGQVKLKTAQTPEQVSAVFVSLLSASVEQTTGTLLSSNASTGRYLNKLSNQPGLQAALTAVCAHLNEIKLPTHAASCSMLQTACSIS
jgi:hypothetical protein